MNAFPLSRPHAKPPMGWVRTGGAGCRVRDPIPLRWPSGTSGPTMVITVCECATAGWGEETHERPSAVSRACAATPGTTRLPSLVFISLVQAAYSVIRHERVVPKWDRKRDPNILNNHYRFENANQDVVVPDNTQGAVLAKSEFGDCHVEIDKRGRLSISGAQVTKAQLVEIVNVRAAQAPPPRFLLWADYRCRAEVRDTILSLVTNIAPEQTYFVVREGNHRDMNIVYKALHYNKLVHVTE